MGSTPAQGAAGDCTEAYQRLSEGTHERGEPARVFEQLSRRERSLDPELDASCYWSLHLAVSYLAELDPEQRPRRLDAVGLFEEVRAELGASDPAELLRTLGFLFQELGRAGESALLARHGLASFPGSHVEAALQALLAEEARQGWRLDQAEQSLERGYGALARSRRPVRDERELLAPEVRIRIDQGLPDQAWEPLERYRDLVELELEDERDTALQILEELDVSWLLATERFDEIVALLGPREQLSAKLRLDLAIALSERARLNDEPSGRASALLAELHGDAGLPPGLRWFAGGRLAEIRLRDGELDAAQSLIEAAVGSTPPNPVERLRFETLRARLELARGSSSTLLGARRLALKAAFEQVLDRQKAAPVRPGGTGYLHFLDVRAALSELVELTRRQEGAAAALEELLAVRELGSLARSLGGPATTLAALRAQLLPAGGGILAYLPGPERSHVFLLDAEAVRCEELAAQREWDGARARLQQDLMVPPRADDPPAIRVELDRRLAGLAQVLLPERTVQAELRTWSEVIVEGLGPAGYVPLEALPLSDGVPLGMALPVSYLPSLSVGTRLVQRARPRPAPRADLSVVAAPLEVDRAAIPWRSHDTRALARWCRPERLELRLGEDATRASLFEPACMDASWLLLVLHGAYDTGRERAAGFLLGRDPLGAPARLFPEDVESLSVPPLVFLAICGAARGNLRNGDDGITDLGGAFLLAGAETVVLSPIDLEFSATIQLAASFQREAAAGATAARALQLARIELAARPGYDHPYYHALLHVVGLGARPVYAEPLAGLGAGADLWRRSWIWALGATLSLLAVFALRGLTRTWGSRSHRAAAGS